MLLSNLAHLQNPIGPSIEFYKILLKTVCPDHEKHKALVHQLPFPILCQICPPAFPVCQSMSVNLVLLSTPHNRKQEVHGRYSKSQCCKCEAVCVIKLHLAEAGWSLCKPGCCIGVQCQRIGARRYEVMHEGCNISTCLHYSDLSMPSINSFSLGVLFRVWF